MIKVLFVDACPRAESRTRGLAKAVLSHIQGDVTTLKLADEELPDIDENAVLARFQDVKKGCFDHPVYDYAKQFADADMIVMAAPYWDLSFPAILKKYIEAITVSGITFGYNDQGIPLGKCRAKALYYITTSGGPIFHEEFGYGYIRTLAQTMYGIKTCCCFQAENLDIQGADTEALLQRTEKKIEEYFLN